jgi:hypothetical protein
MFTHLLFIRKKMNCSIVLTSQNNEIPARKALPSRDDTNSDGKAKQSTATKRKK